MDPVHLEARADDPRFIPGIYNYCDRWCERCPLSGRCLLYATEKASGQGATAQCVTSEALGQQLMESLARARELITALARERGIDLDDLEVQDAERKWRRRQARARTHPLARLARSYIQGVDTWFKAATSLFQEKQQHLLELGRLAIGDPGREADAIRDAVEVVRWYQHQLYVKLTRALCGREAPVLLDDAGVPLPRDADGSAKVALLGIDRSTAAWARLYQQFPDRADATLDQLVTLERLRRGTEALFPAARAFRRPGFDTA